MAQRVLVTGGAGFIGRHLCRALAEHGYKVGVLDIALENSDLANSVYRADVRDEIAVRQVLSWFKPLIVYHLAALTSVRESMKEPREYVLHNVLGTATVAQAAVQAGVEKIVFASSGGTVYGEPLHIPVPVDHYPSPKCVYGASKLAGENILRAICQEAAVKWYNLRLPNVYGPGQDESGEAGVVAKFITSLLSGVGPRINGDGEQARDFVYVGDVVKLMLMTVATRPAGTYNLGSGRATSILELLELVEEAVMHKVKPRHGPRAQSEIDRIALEPSITLTKPTDLRTGLRKTAEWYQEKVK